MAGRIPQNFIDEVLRRTDIVDLISGQVRLKKTGKNYSACCPFHNENHLLLVLTAKNSFITALVVARLAMP